MNSLNQFHLRETSIAEPEFFIVSFLKLVVCAFGLSDSVSGMELSSSKSAFSKKLSVESHSI